MTCAAKPFCVRQRRWLSAVTNPSPFCKLLQRPCSHCKMCDAPHVSIGSYRLWSCTVLVLLIDPVIIAMFCVTCSFSTRVLSAKVRGLPHVQVRWRADLWQVSSHGRVRSSIGVVSLGNACGAYRQVQIGGQKFYVHRLVARAFLELPSGPGPYQVNHIDGDGNNNCVHNLQYVTPQENIRRSYITSPDRGAKRGKPVFWRECGTTEWNMCPSQAAASRLLGMRGEAVSKCCRGIMKRSRSKENGAWFEFECAAPKRPSWQVDEAWQPARYPGESTVFPDIMVSSHGRLFWCSSNLTGITHGTRTGNGYYSFQAQGRVRLVHRSVAATFLGQPESPNLQVNHKDRDRRNNHVNNLEYVTASQNIRHSFKHMTADRRRGKPVLAKLVASEGVWTRCESIAAAAEHTGLSRRAISRACHSVGPGRENGLWSFKFAADEHQTGEEWRFVVLDGARGQKHTFNRVLRPTSTTRISIRPIGPSTLSINA